MKDSSPAQEIADYERSVTAHEQNETLRRFYARTRWEATEEKTPLDELLSEEESARCPHCKEQIESTAELEKWSMRNETTRRLFEFFAQDGLELHHVLRNVYAVGAHMGIAPWSDLTVRERGVILGESHGAQHWSMQQNCVNFLMRKGAKSIKAPGQKGLHARAAFAEAQRGNSNRKRKPNSRHRRTSEQRKKTE